MKSLYKTISLMGGRHQVGGVAVSADHILFICYTDINRIVAYDLVSDTIKMSMQALSFADYCEAESITYINHPSQPTGILILMKNGDVWLKSLSDGAEYRWGSATPPATPECRGATAIEYYDGALYVAFAKDNKIRRMAFPSLATVASYSTGAKSGGSTATPYAPEALAYDGILNQFAAIDPTTGTLIYMEPTSFVESGYERYIYHIYNDFFTGDLTISKANLPATGSGYFVLGFGPSVGIYTDSWYRLYEVDDLTGNTTEVGAPVFDDIPAGQSLVKHFRLVNTSSILRPAVVLTVANDVEHNVDECLTSSVTSTAGTWERQTPLGDISASGHKDFYMRFYPQTTTEIGRFVVEIVIDHA